ncbi:MAG TPA: ABC transporter substrate-binding protein, partial [Xanthomonadales bacterium]|nr:ABC transporter substrate-binding protein [Xanthomonadales bacterium]
MNLAAPAWLKILFAALMACSVTAQANQPLRLGLVAFIGEATNFHAVEQGYFEAEGLDVSVTINQSGFQALPRLLAGEFDLCTAEPTPIIYAALAHSEKLADFRIVASILESSSINTIVALDKRRVSSLQDLQGKRLGLAKGTSIDYFWHLVSTNYGIDRDSVQTINIQVPDMAQAARQGNIDAAVVWRPYHRALLREAPKHGLQLTIGRVYTTSWMAVANKAFLESRPEAVIAYLRALARAEADLERDPGAVAQSHARWLDADPQALVEDYGLLDFDLSLTEGLLISL